MTAKQKRMARLRETDVNEWEGNQVGIRGISGAWKIEKQRQPSLKTERGAKSYSKQNPVLWRLKHARPSSGNKTISCSRCGLGKDETNHRILECERA